MQLLKPSYSLCNQFGIMRCDAVGDAWQIHWQKNGDLPRDLAGVALVIGSTVFAARSAGVADHGFPSPGIVVYERDASGQLPARWYNPDLKGKPGKGLSLDGPVDGYVGKYRAEYASSEGEFEPLTKEITRQGGAYRFAWRTATEIIYTGIGIEHGQKLVAAWSTPRERLEVVVYELADDGSKLSGVFVASSDSEGQRSPETWRAD